MQLRNVLPLLILLFAVTASAQDNQCTLKLAQLSDAPELFGFHLGMSRDQVKARVPQVVFAKTNKFGADKTSINPDFNPKIDKSTFAGVRTISLDFLDDRITSLWLGYDSSFKWHTVPDFVEGISRALHLPAAWSTWRSRGQQLRCADFQLTVSMVADGPSFRILDETAEETLNARRDAAEEQPPEETSEEVVANKQTKTYYPRGCHPANEIKAADRIVFQEAGEAEKAGYKKATQCD